MNKIMTKKEREAWVKERLVAADAWRREVEALPGYADVLAETYAQNEVAGVAQKIAAKSKLTQKEIARRMNVSQPRVSQIANGEDLSLSTLYRYAAACGAKLRITVVF